MSGSVLIDPAGLRALRASGARLVLLDVRWALGRTDGRERYRAGHLPGAVFVDLDTELAGPPSARDGRHPLPDPAALQEAVRRWGIDAGSTVIGYDDNGGLAAARAWWLLRWAGLADVRLLDGGLPAWIASGGTLDTSDVEPTPGTAAIRPGGMPVLDADEAAELARHGVLLDARAGERYRGEAEPIDPRAGHIPGALSAPTADNIDGDGRFRTDLAERFAGLGADGTRPVGVYCGSGVTAAHEVAALAVAGIPAALYVGSWSQWSNDPARPVEPS